MCDFDLKDSIDYNDSTNSTTFNILKAIEELTRNEMVTTGQVEEQLDPDIERQCDDCGIVLTKNAKYKLKCVRCYNKIYSLINRQKFRLYHRQKYLANREQVLKVAKEMREANKSNMFYSNDSIESMESMESQDDKCIVCGNEPENDKLLLRGKCGRCYKRLYQRSYRDKSMIKKPEYNSFDATQLECLLTTLKNNEMEPSTSQRIEDIEAIEEKPSQTNKVCEECQIPLSTRTTISRCKRCNKNFHRRMSRKRVRERTGIGENHCETCGLILNDVVGNVSECPNCPSSKSVCKEEAVVSSEKGLDLLQYLSTIASSSNSIQPIAVKKEQPAKQTRVSRGDCEDCGLALSHRGYLQKCRRCNKKDYKRMVRQQRRDEKLTIPNIPCLNLDKPTTNITQKCCNIDNESVKSVKTENGAENSPKFSKKSQGDPRYCVECSKVLHYSSRGELCCRCNKKKYKREARRRKREQKLAANNEFNNEIDNPLSSVINQFSIDGNCLTTECDMEEQSCGQSLLDYLISQRNN